MQLIKARTWCGLAFANQVAASVALTRTYLWFESNLLVPPLVVASFGLYPLIIIAANQRLTWCYLAGRVSGVQIFPSADWSPVKGRQTGRGIEDSIVTSVCCSYVSPGEPALIHWFKRRCLWVQTSSACLNAPSPVFKRVLHRLTECDSVFLVTLEMYDGLDLNLVVYHEAIESLAAVSFRWDASRWCQWIGAVELEIDGLLEYLRQCVDWIVHSYVLVFDLKTAQGGSRVQAHVPEKRRRHCLALKLHLFSWLS